MRFGWVGVILLVGSCSEPQHHLTDQDLCTAVVSIGMGTDPLIMRSVKNNGIVTISYNTESDGKLWKYKCKREGNQIVWGMNRFHTHELDTKYYFIIKDDELIITEKYYGGPEQEIHKFPVEFTN